MSTRKNTLLGLCVLTACALFSGAAHAQIAQDFPNLKGSDTRTGANGAPFTSGPGQGYLDWFSPNDQATGVLPGVYTYTMVLDNTDVSGSTYDPPRVPNTQYSWNYGVVSASAADSNNLWNPPNPNQEASSPFNEYAIVNPATAGYPSYDFRSPDYLMTLCTPSDTSGNPTAPADTTKLNTFSWEFYPNGDPNGTAFNAVQTKLAALPTRYFALYVWLPYGPSELLNGKDTVFPERYFVYNVHTYLNGQPVDLVDVVDTYAAGSGWVRLGGGGLPTNACYPYDGTHSIKITLFNTIPRYVNGNPTMPSAATSYCVYADAAKAVPVSGYYLATPISATVGGVVSTFGYINQTTLTGLDTSISTTNPTPVFSLQAILTSYNYSTGTVNWTYSPQTTTTYVKIVDNLDGPPTVVPLALNPLTRAPDPNGTNSFVPPASNNSVGPDNYYGPDYWQAAIQDPLSEVTYSPNLTDGKYFIYARIPGNVNTLQFSPNVHYQIMEDGKALDVGVDQSVASITGWTLVGSRSYDNSAAAPLQVLVYNEQLGGGGDGKLLIDADAIRFVKSGSGGASSTPVFANVNIKGKGKTNVVLTADESGRLHCVDAAGNGDGTTTEYWSYPSTLPTGTADPNQDPLFDGVGPLAEMPSGFDLSTAIVETTTVTGLAQDRLYIGTTNGRIYCINMEGRGDFAANAGFPGTTNRIWTFPSVYQAQTATSFLGGFKGSLLFFNNKVIAPTAQGRLYVFPAEGNADGLGSNPPEWTFPDPKSPALGPIWGTPAIMTTSTGQNLIFFGTLENPNVLPTTSPGLANGYEPNNTSNYGTQGAFYAVNLDTPHDLKWMYTRAIGNTAGDVPTGDFLSGPAAVLGDSLDKAAPAQPQFTNKDTVFALNENHYVYAFDAAGDGLGNPKLLWTTNELGAGARASLGYTEMTVYDNGGALNPYPVLLVPTSSGQFDALFCRTSDVNVDGGRLAWQYIAQGDSLTSSMAFSNGWMYGADSAGFLYAFSNDPSGYGNTSGFVPGQGGIVINDPRGAAFRNPIIQLVNETGYNLLRQAPTNVTYNDISTNKYPRSQPAGTTTAFEWGETAYIIVYNFPYTASAFGNAGAAPPIVNIQFDVNGKTVRSIPVQSRQFANPSSKTITINGNPVNVDGYSVLAFTFQNSGPNSLPPGNADISVSISTSAFSSSGSGNAVNTVGVLQNVFANPNSKVPFVMANPLAVGMVGIDWNGSSAPGNAGIGVNTLPWDAQNMVNGSPPVGGVAFDRLMSSAGNVGHGQTGHALVQVFDRSLMCLVRPDGGGMDGVRVNLRNLNWQGGSASVVSRLNTTLFPGFEDVANLDNFPNDSIDYPDINKGQLRAIKDPNGTAENPAFNGVTLKAPLDSTGNHTLAATDIANGQDPTARKLVPTLFDFAISVPRYQPANLFSGITDSAGKNPAEGYTGRADVFVDSIGSGQFTPSVSEAYRRFGVASSVGVDDRLVFNTPQVDLGELAAGIGYPSATTFSPTNNASWFKPFEVQNIGNVNLLDVRVAKSSLNVNDSSNTLEPVGFFSLENDVNSWLDASVDLHANIDMNLSTPNPYQTGNNPSPVIIQKPRVGDPQPTELSINPVRRVNANLGKTGLLNGNVDALNTNLLAFPPGPPQLSATIPIGFPVGKYVQNIRVRDASLNESQHKKNSFQGVGEDWWVNGDAVSDNALPVIFNVRETRLTNKFTDGTMPMVDNPANVTPSTSPLEYSNLLPAAVRDDLGNLIVAWTSDRDKATIQNLPTGFAEIEPYRIYVAGLKNGYGLTQSSFPNPQGALISPLSDLNAFQSVSNNQWFLGSGDTTQGYPGAGIVDSVFSLGAGETVIPKTERFMNPSFPARGMIDPYSLNPQQTTYMAFVGEAQKKGATDRQLISQIMLTQVSHNNQAAVSLSAPSVLPSDTTSVKGKPAVVMAGSGAMVFYPAASGSASEIYYARYNPSLPGGWSHVSPLPFGNGFDWVGSPSAAARNYRDSTTRIVDLTFTGKLHGRPNAEVYMGRLSVVDNGNAQSLPETTTTDLSGNPFMYLAAQTDERLIDEGAGMFRARGVDWNLGGDLVLKLDYKNGSFKPDDLGVSPPILYPNTRIFDRATGLISYDSDLGKIYFDPYLGRIHFAAGPPPRNVELRLTYQPQFLRVSRGSQAAYSSATGLYDGRFATDQSYWNSGSGARVDRYIYTFTKGATAAGQSARPFMTTFRLGVRLDFRIQTNQDGSIAPGFNVVGLDAPIVGPYQVDPVNGRVYFTAVDEDKRVEIAYPAIDEHGDFINIAGTKYANKTGTISFVLERDEQAIPISQATNETSLAPFIDPFDYAPTSTLARPLLIWMFWTSRRDGAPDVYFESLAPHLTPVPAGK